MSAPELAPLTDTEIAEATSRLKWGLSRQDRMEWMDAYAARLLFMLEAAEERRIATLNPDWEALHDELGIARRGTASLRSTIEAQGEQIKALTEEQDRTLRQEPVTGRWRGIMPRPDYPRGPDIEVAYVLVGTILGVALVELAWRLVCR